jgi:hypothetical protein
VPPIFLHMAMAKDARDRVDAGVLGDHAGAYYLGATTPDIRVLTRWGRERTHFFDLSVTEHQDSVATMFEAHPHLAHPEHLSPETVSFVAGYAGHLALDETWIVQVYRPHFGQLSALGGDAQANIMDRLLQFELDRRRREDVGTASEIRAALECCSPAIDVGFLDSETLGRWLEVAIDQTRHPPTWERFATVGSRHLKGLGIDSEDALANFMQRVPEVLERTIRHVSTAHVDAYLEQSAERAARVVEQYLDRR